MTNINHTVTEAAEILRVDPETIRVWLREGKLKGFKVGRGWRIKALDLEMMDASEEAPAVDA